MRLLHIHKDTFSAVLSSVRPKVTYSIDMNCSSDGQCSGFELIFKFLYNTGSALEFEERMESVILRAKENQKSGKGRHN